MSFNQFKTPKVFQVTVGQDAVFGTSNILIFSPQLATSCQVENMSEHAVLVQMNGDPGAEFNLAGGSTQNFTNDIYVKSLDFQPVTLSGGSSIDVQVIVGLVNP